jgi:hypothetical protein
MLIERSSYRPEVKKRGKKASKAAVVMMGGLL